ncbi:L-fucose mutarotase [Halalkalibacter urbisdiaboli]|uniref:L-fucose mutarotase n=1 Tax=Halalkalibacter urbisdiaboli TaxID=1960589 RepID=UPI000B42D2A6|nr:L-fucose mutarotase [Halalkalibacter urbisdiaboli]
MLKGIPRLLSPELVKVLMEMGHGDEIVFADGNFPAASHNSRVIRCDGHGIPELLNDILTLFPLDSYVEEPVALMAVEARDDFIPSIWDVYKNTVAEACNTNVRFEKMERFAFYERAKSAYAIVATGEKALYANILLKKGTIN